MVNRRGFLAAVCALPFVGRLIPKAAAPARPMLTIPELSAYTGHLRGGKTFAALMRANEEMMAKKDLELWIANNSSITRVGFDMERALDDICGTGDTTYQG